VSPAVCSNTQLNRPTCTVLLDAPEPAPVSRPVEPTAPTRRASAPKQAARDGAGSLEEVGLNVYSVRTSFRLILFAPLSNVQKQMPPATCLPLASSPSQEVTCISPAVALSVSVRTNLPEGS